MTAPSSARSIVVGDLFGLLWRMQVSRTRFFGLAALGVLAIPLALIASNSDDKVEAVTEAIAGYGFGVAAAVCSLWVATSTLGNLADDKLLVYLWIKPIDRWQLPVAAVAASMAVLSIVVIVPVVVATALSGVGELVAPTAIGLVLVCLAYSSVFVALGLRFQRSLWWGLMYVLIWENSIARISDGTARLSIQGYGHAFLTRATGVELDLGNRATVTSWVVPILISVAGLVYATRRLDQGEID